MWKKYILTSYDSRDDRIFLENTAESRKVNIIELAYTNGRYQLRIKTITQKARDEITARLSQIGFATEFIIKFFDVIYLECNEASVVSALLMIICEFEPKLTPALASLKLDLLQCESDEAEDILAEDGNEAEDILPPTDSTALTKINAAIPSIGLTGLELPQWIQLGDFSKLLSVNIWQPCCRSEAHTCNRSDALVARVVMEAYIYDSHLLAIFLRKDHASFGEITGGLVSVTIENSRMHQSLAILKISPTTNSAEKDALFSKLSALEPYFSSITGKLEENFSLLPPCYPLFDQPPPAILPGFSSVATTTTKHEEDDDEYEEEYPSLFDALSSQSLDIS